MKCLQCCCTLVADTSIPASHAPGSLKAALVKQQYLVVYASQAIREFEAANLHVFVCSRFDLELAPTDKINFDGYQRFFSLNAQICPSIINWNSSTHTKDCQRAQDVHEYVAPPTPSRAAIPLRGITWSMSSAFNPP